MRTFRVIVATLAAFLMLAPSAGAQSAAEMDALEARLMARLEARLAEETEAMRSEQAVFRASVQDAVRTLASSQNQIDRRAIVAVASGRTDAGLGVLEERARARDAQANAANTPAARQARSEEWRRIGALAFLESTERSIGAFEQALTFAPNDPQLLDQLAQLYERQGRHEDERRIGERLIGLGDPVGRAKGNIYISSASTHLGDNDAAISAANDAVAAAREAQVPEVLVEALCQQAAAYALARNLRTAERSADEATLVARENNLELQLGYAHGVAGLIHRVKATQSLFSREASARRAIAEYTQAAEIFHRLHNLAFEGAVLTDLQDAERIAGDYQSAETHARAAIAIFEPMGARRPLAMAQVGLGVALAKQARVEESRSAFQLGLDGARALGNHQLLAYTLATWGSEEMNFHNGPRACALLTEASNLMNSGDLATGLDRFAVGMARSAACSMR